jgi:hypothetical protein
MLSRHAGEPAATRRKALFLADIVPGGIERYASVRTREIDAIKAGYPVVQ